MPMLGLTKLDAVNEMLEAINEPIAPALDTDGTSEVAEAERILDRISTRVQSRGWPENTLFSKTLTPDGGNIKAPDKCVWLRPAGKNAHRHLVLRGEFVYDMDADSATAFGSTTIDFDVISVVRSE